MPETAQTRPFTALQHGGAEAADFTNTQAHRVVPVVVARRTISATLPLLQPTDREMWVVVRLSVLVDYSGLVVVAQEVPA